MQHGTPTGWRWHKCRCEACHRALLAEGRVTWAARRVRKGADPATRVRADRARRHVEALIAAGWSANAVARAAGVSGGTVSRLRQPATKRVSRIVSLNLLGVGS